MRLSRSPVSLALGGFLAMAVAVGVGRFVYTPILPPMLAALGLSKATAGLIASANFAGYLAGALICAGAALPGSRRTWLLAALVVSAVTTGAMGYVVSAPAFMVLQFAGGVASAFGLILSSALVLDRLMAAQRAKLAAVHFAGVGIGIAGSAALVAVLLGLGFDWAALWQASGAVSLFGCAAAALLLPGDPGGARATHRPTEAVPADPRLRRTVVAYGLFGFGYVITATFLVAMVRATPSIRSLEPVIWVVVGCAAAPSVMLWTALSRRIGVPAAFATAALAEAVGVMSSVVWPSLPGMLLAAVLVGGTFMGLTALGLILARELARGDPRRMMAAMTAAFGVGQIVGPVLAGGISDALGGFGVPSTLAAAALLGAAWLCWPRD